MAVWSSHGQAPRLELTHSLRRVGLLAAILLASCVDGSAPIAPAGMGAGVRIPISASVLPQAADAASPSINRIRAVARVVPGGTVLGSAILDVNPGADGWAVEIPVDLGSFPSATVEVSFELISVSPSGQETVAFSGKSEPIVVRAGSDSQPVVLPLVQGGLGNLKVTGVQITEPVAAVLEGATRTLAATVTTSDPSVSAEVFWSSLDPDRATMSGNVATGALPGVARIVATAGAKSDTVALTVLARPASVRVTPDSQAVVGNGVTVTLTGLVLDARGAAIDGQPVLWRSLTPAILEDQGSGRFRSIAPGRGVVEARAAADTTLKGSASVRVNRAGTDVAITKTVGSPTALEGDPITFTITARNGGEVTASSVQVVEQFPAGLTMTSSSASAGSFASGVWTVGDLAPGASATLQIGARNNAGTAGTTQTNTARLLPLADQQDLNSGNDVASASVTVGRRTVDIAVTKTVANASVNEGDTAVFTITVRNNGPYDASGVIVVDSLPPELAYVSHQNSRGSFASGTRLWDVGGIPAGTTETLVLRALVRTNNQTVRNRVRVMAIGNADDSQRANDTASAAVVIGQPVSDIAVAKTSDKSTAVPGDTVKFTVTLTNVAGIAATNILVTDTIKAPFQLLSVTTTGGAVADNVASTIRVPSLARGSVATAVYTVKIDAAAPLGTLLTNSARLVSSLPSDPNTGNNVATASVAVGPLTSIEGTVTESGSPSSGVTVRLLTSGSVLITTTTTNSSGVYRFNRPGLGSYLVDVSAPSGKVVSPANRSVTLDATHPTAAGHDFTLATNAGEAPGFLRPNVMVCGGSSHSPTTFFPSGTSFTVLSGCTPDSNTQALFVTRGGGYSVSGSVLQAYVSAGGIVITEYSISHTVWNVTFGTALSPVYVGGPCKDIFPSVVQFNPSDPFWQGVPYQQLNYSDTGCGYSVSHFTGITTLAGWDASHAALGYRNLGSGRVWAADWDWQDNELYPYKAYTEQALGYMMTHRGTFIPAIQGGSIRMDAPAGAPSELGPLPPHALDDTRGPRR